MLRCISEEIGIALGLRYYKKALKEFGEYGSRGKLVGFKGEGP
jgi:hypothetical protein